MDAAISTRYRVKVNLNLEGGKKKEVVIDWVHLVGHDKGKKEVRAWIDGVFSSAKNARLNCKAVAICKGLADLSDKPGDRLCFDCDFFKTGIDNQSLGCLNDIIRENGGRRVAAEESSLITFEDLASGNPAILLEYPDQLDVGVQQEKKPERPGPLCKKMVVKKEEKPKQIKDGRGKAKPRRSWSRVPRLELRFGSGKFVSLGKMAKSKAEEMALERANKLNKPVEIWKKGKGKKPDTKVAVIKPDQEISSGKRSKKTKDQYVESSRSVQTVKKRSLSPAKLMSEQLKERINEIFKNLPIDIDAESDDGWRVVNAVPANGQDKIFLCAEEVGPSALFRGAVTSKELKKLILNTASTPIPGKILARSLIPEELCKIFNKLFSSMLRANEPILKGD